MPSRRHSSAMLSSPRSPSSTTRIFSSAEKCRRGARRMSLIASSAGCFSGPDFCLIFAPCGYDDPEILPKRKPPTVSKALTADSRRRHRPTSQWHLDEMAVLIAGRRFWLWRAVDDEGEVLDLLVQRRRDKTAAVKLMRKLLTMHGFAPDVLVTDKLRSYAAAKSEPRLRLGMSRACGETIGPRIRTCRFVAA